MFQKVFGVPSKDTMEQFYHQLLEIILKTGKLSLKQRKHIWKRLEETTSQDTLPAVSPCTSKIHSKHKKMILALRSLLKVSSIWENDDSFLLQMKIGISSIASNIYICDRVHEIIQGLCDLCDDQRNTENDFYIGYIRQALLSFQQALESGDDSEGYSEDSLKDEDLEVEELDTSYCACILWKYQQQDSPAKVRENREKEFWKWYVQEAAFIQGIVIEDIEKNKRIADEQKQKTDNIKLETIEDFVKNVSHDFHYMKYEKKNQEVIIYVFEQKDGSCCPKCGGFSNHVKFTYGGIMRLGKINGWKIILDVSENDYFCDNPDCSELSFLTKSNVDFKARTANYKYLKSIPGNEKKICELLGIM